MLLISSLSLQTQPEVMKSVPWLFALLGRRS